MNCWGDFIGVGVDCCMYFGERVVYVWWFDLVGVIVFWLSCVEKCCDFSVFCWLVGGWGVVFVKRV